jgi:integrase
MEGVAEVFKLSRRKGSAKWQVRKRWPSDVGSVLKGEFNFSTGEEDRKAAQQRLPLIAAEYERRVAAARDQMAEVPRTELTQAEVHRMTAEFYRTTLPWYIVRRPVEALQQASLLKSTGDTLAALRRLLGRGDYSAVFPAARTWARQQGFSLPEGASADYLHQMLMRAFIELHEATYAHLSGETHYEPRDRALASAPAELALSAPESPSPPSKTVENLIEAYEADKAPSWSGSSKKAVVPVFRVMRDLFAGRELAGVTRDDAREVMKLLEGLPLQLGNRKELRGLTIREAVEKARELTLPTLSPKTINDGYLLHVASMFNWARKEQWVASNPFEGLRVFDPVDDAERRDPFTVEQLNALFRSPPWQRAWQGGAKAPGAFWVPLLCLFHGLRNGEAAGLRVQDVGEEDGFVVLYIRPYGDKRLKTKEARGTLPVHPELLRMGFLGFVAERREGEAELLFPEGTTNSRGQVAAKLGERFSGHVRKLGFTGRKLGMHSFRHNFEDRLRAAELPERTALALARRTEAGSSSVYGQGLSARQKAAALAKISYPGLDLSHLEVIASQADAKTSIEGG